MIDSIINESQSAASYNDFSALLKSKKSKFSLIIDNTKIDSKGQSIQHIWHKTLTEKFSLDSRNQISVTLNLVIRIKRKGEMTIAYTVGAANDLTNINKTTEFAKVLRVQAGAQTLTMLVPAYPSTHVNHQPINFWSPDVHRDAQNRPIALGEAHFPVIFLSDNEWRNMTP